MDFQPLVLAKSVLASLFMFGLLSWVSTGFGAERAASAIGVGVTLGIVAYIGGLFALGTFSKKEMQFIKSLVYIETKE